MGNGEAKELYVQPMDMNRENAGGRGDAGWRGIKGRKKWDSCKSKINII